MSRKTAHSGFFVRLWREHFRELLNTSNLSSVEHMTLLRICLAEVSDVVNMYAVLGPLLLAIQSLYNQIEGCVHILGRKSNIFPGSVGLCLICPFVIFMDRISRCSQGVERLNLQWHLSFLQMTWLLWLRQRLIPLGKFM